MYNKKMLINLFNDCMFVCQRLYQISQRGIWTDVREAGQSVLDRITDNAELTEEQFKALRDEMLSNMYAAAEDDD